MNILLWILQILIAFWGITGGMYMMDHYNDLATNSALNMMPQVFWFLLAGLEIVLAVCIVIPYKYSKLQKLNAFAAIGFSVISLLSLLLYTGYQGFPGMLWGIVPAIVCSFVAFKRAF